MSLRLTSITFLLLLTCPIQAADGRHWVDVPFVPQSRDGCGAAAIAMVMQYWIRSHPHLDAAAADDSHIYKLLSTPGRRGLSGDKLRQYLEQTGYSAHVFRGEPQDLSANLEKGRPLVVCLAPRGANVLLHFVVVTGATNSAILYHDPARGKLIEHRIPSFLRQWEATGFWTLLATPRLAQ